MEELTVSPDASQREGIARRQPRSYRIVDWSLVPEDLVDAVRAGNYPPRAPRSIESRLSRFLIRVFFHDKSVENTVRSAITVTEWPSEPTTTQRRLMDLVIDAEDAVDQLEADLGSRLTVIRHYPETDLRRDLEAIGVAAYRLLPPAGSRVQAPVTRSTIDGEAELARRVEALSRFCVAAVRENPFAAA